jgi:hypothetical protein
MRILLTMTWLILLGFPGLVAGTGEKAMKGLAGRSAYVSNGRIATAAARPVPQEHDAIDESADYHQVVSALQDLVTRNPAALFALGALLLIFATSLRVKVTRNLGR